MLKEIIIFEVMLIMLSFVLVQFGVDIEYVALGVMILLTVCIVVMLVKHIKIIREELRLK